MSQVYSTEPQTSGRVILDTTHGPIDIHLFCKECPTTCRSFLQLVMDGYYDDMMFHRCIDNFLVQTGERHIPSTSKNCGYKFESFDLDKKKLEVVPRIKFNHRGQIAWALPLEDDGNPDSATEVSLSRQFFITLDEAPFLDKKYVIFGTIRGDTIFNALRIGKTETIGESGELADKDNPPKIKSVRIKSHLFDDLVVTDEKLVPWKMDARKEENAIKKRRKKRKGKRDLNVLSFGDEMKDTDDELDRRRGIRSSHDQYIPTERNMDIGKKKSKERSAISPQELKQKKTRDTETQIPEQKKAENFHHSTDKQFNDLTQKERDTAHLDARKKAEKITPMNTKETIIECSISSTKKDPIPTSALEVRRMKYLSGRGSRKASKKRDTLTMSKLSQFKSNMFQVKGVDLDEKTSEGPTSRHIKDNSIAIRMAKRLESTKGARVGTNSATPAYSGQILEDDDIDNKGGSRAWLKYRFKCKRHIDHNSKDDVLGGDGRKTNEYEVIDEKRRRRELASIGGKYHS